MKLYFVAVMDYDVPKTVEQCREKLRDEFNKNKHVTDIRVIDMLVIKVCIFDCTNESNQIHVNQIHNIMAI
jgi:hypothetical protein